MESIYDIDELKKSINEIKELIPETVQVLIEISGENEKLTTLAISYGIVLSIVVDRIARTIKTENFERMKHNLLWMIYISFIIGAFYALTIEDTKINEELIENIEKILNKALNETAEDWG